MTYLSGDSTAYTVLIAAVVHSMNQEVENMQIIVGVIGVCAVALLLYYVYILVKGDKNE